MHALLSSYAVSCRRMIAGALLLLAMVPAAQGQVGAEWRLRTPAPSAESWYGAASLGGQTVVVGSGGAVLNSTDGVSWTVQKLGKNTLQSVASSGTLLLASAPGNGTVWLSNDGLSWTAHTISKPDSTSVRTVIWDGSQWVAISDDNDNQQTLLKSTDGITWTRLGDLPPYDTSTTSRYISGVTYTGSRYVVVGGLYSQGVEDVPYIATTSDGSNWQEVSLGTAADFSATTGNNLSDVVWTGTQLVAVGTNDMVYTSPDSATWTRRTMTSGGRYIQSVTWTGAQLVAFVGDSVFTGPGTVETSPDGVAWTDQGQPNNGPFAVTKAAWTGSMVVAVDAFSGVFTSPTGSMFTRRLPSSGANNNLAAIAASPSGLLAADAIGNALTSAAGDTWASAPITGNLSSSLRSIVWSGSKWVGTDQSNALATSTDGLAWTVQVPDDGSTQIMRLGAGAGKVVAVGGTVIDLNFNTKVMVESSADGITWTKATLPTINGLLYDVTYTGSQWVAVGGNSTVFTSPDATTWTRRTVANAGYIYGVASSGPLIVAVSDQGSLTSANGIAWTLHPWAPNLFVQADPPNRVVWSGSNFVAINNESVGAETSPDGITWTVQDVGTGVFFSDIAADAANHQVVVVGQNGLVLTTDATPSVQFTDAGQSVFESDGNVHVTVRLAFPAPVGFTVPFTLGGTAVSGTDYGAATPAVFAFSAGDMISEITIPLINDTFVELSRTLVLTLGTPAGPTGAVRLGARTTHMITIKDDDMPPMVTFTKTDDTVSEGEGTLGVEVQLSWSPNTTTTVPLTLGGTAAGTRYTVTPTTLTFAPGTRSQMVSITINDDALVQPDETLVLGFGSLTNASPGATTSFTLTVKDNDPASQPGKQWTLRNPLPSSEGMHAITTIIAQSVIVGGGGLALTSADGTNWVRRHTGTNASINAILWTDLSFPGLIAVGERGHVLTSPDGVLWADHVVPGAENVTFNAISQIPGEFAIAGSVHDNSTGDDTPVFYRSNNGIDWTARVLPTAHGVVKSLVYLPAWGYVMVGSGQGPASATAKYPLIMDLSTDRSAAVTGVSFDKVLNLAGTLYAFCNSTKVYTSPNGRAWTAITAGTGALGALDAATTINDGKTLVAVGNDIAVGVINSGVLSWKQKASGTTAPLRDITWRGGSNFIAIGNNTVVTTSDNLTWTAQAPGIDQSAGGGNGNGFLGVAWSGAKFVAVGGVHPGKALAATSADGVTWTPRTVAGPDALQDVVWSGKQFVAVGFQGMIRTSPDGAEWITRTSGTKQELRRVIWAGNQFVCVGGSEFFDDDPLELGSIVLTSPDGITWTRHSMPVPANHPVDGQGRPTGNPVNGIAFTGHTYVAAGTLGAIWTSPDAAAWTLRSSGINGIDLGAVAWNGSKLVTLTVEGSPQVITSADGVAWSPATSQPMVPPPPAGSDENGASGAVWTGTQFVLVGDRGVVLTSPDGNVWTAQHSGTNNDLVGVCWNGSILVAAGLNSTLIASGSGVPPVPQVQFAVAASAVSESSGAAASILVTMSSPPTVKTTVPFTFTPLPATLPNVIAPVASVVFNPGETSKFITIAIKDDVLVEGTETLTLTLQTPTPVAGAVLGAGVTHALTISDNDLVPTITVPPQHQLVAVGAPLAIIGGGTGTGTLAYQWMKDGKALAGATQPVYYVASTALTHAGQYALVVKNPSGSVTSNTVQVGVYDGKAHASVVASGTTVPFVQAAASAAGHPLTFKWVDAHGAALVAVPGHLAIEGNTLTLTNVTAADVAQYQCQVLQPESSLLDNAARFQLDVISGAPTFTSASLALPAGRVGEVYSSGVSSNLTSGSFATFTASGLPAGLTMDAFGNINGIPTVMVTNKAVTVIATNAKGSKSIPATITIGTQVAGFAGTWTGLVAPEPAVNNSLGSALQIVVTTAGSFSGKVTTGTTTTALVGGTLLITNDGEVAYGSAVSSLGAGRSFHVSLYIDTTVTPVLMTGTLDIGFTGATPDGTANITAWQAAASPAAYQGTYTFALDLPGAKVGDLTIPQGTGFVTLKVAAAGSYTVAGNLGDGSVLTGSSSVGSNGQLLLYTSLYGATGSVHGAAKLVLGGVSPGYADTQVQTGQAALTWARKPNAAAASARTYPQGWAPFTLGVSGSKYPAPGTGQLIMAQGSGAAALLNLNVTAPADGSANLGVTVTNKGVGSITSHNASPFDSLTLSVVPSAGTFKGAFVLTDRSNYPTPQKRTAAYSGLIIRDFNGGATASYRGVGWFLLPSLPNLNIYPLPAATTTPIIAGSVALTPPSRL